jgi:hypothetical protein
VLGVATGQHGVVVADSVGVTLEENWLLPLAYIQALQGKGSFAATDQGQRGGTALALVDSSAAMAFHNLLLGFTNAVVASSSRQDTGEGESLMLLNNTAALCGVGVLALLAGSLRLGGNAVEVNNGPALYTRSVVGQVFLEGNDLERLSLEGINTGAGIVAAASAAIADVAEVIAPAAIISSNSFQSHSQSPVSHAVRVRGTNITYTANRSVCAALPVHANVMLQGQNERAMTSLTATSNTCHEPAPPNSEGLAVLASVNSQRQESSQTTLITRLMSSTTAEQFAQFQKDAAKLSEQWASLQKEFAADLAKEQAQHISLLAVAGVAITGANLLSYNLVRLGRGADQGSVSGVF